MHSGRPGRGLNVSVFEKRLEELLPLDGEVPLVETAGNEKLSRPKASIVILEATHFVEEGIAYTKGKYRVVEVFTDNKIHFEGFFGPALVTDGVYF